MKQNDQKEKIKSYKEFKTSLQRYFNTVYDVEFFTQQKINVPDGIELVCITDKKSGVQIDSNLADVYASYVADRSFYKFITAHEKAVDKAIANAISEGVKKTQPYVTKPLRRKNFTKVLLNSELNRSMMRSLVHKKILDLDYCFLLPTEVGDVLLRKDHLQSLGIDAKEATFRTFPKEKVDKINFLTVTVNNENIPSNKACVISDRKSIADRVFDKKVLHKIAEKIGDKFSYVILDEYNALYFSDEYLNSEDSLIDLKTFIVQSNMSNDMQYFISNSVYHYDSETKKLEIKE